MLRANGRTVTTAESCTGGMVAAAITDVAGSSDVFQRGFVTYSNEAKREMLGVAKSTLEAYGAVSEEVAREMATSTTRQPRLPCSQPVSQRASGRRTSRLERQEAQMWEPPASCQVDGRVSGWWGPNHRLLLAQRP
ncbi:MAG: nicotinamide-nucleotide amidohydrolase family protein, partial [Pseudomonadota bacterium]